MSDEKQDDLTALPAGAVPGASTEGEKPPEQERKRADEKHRRRPFDTLRVPDEVVSAFPKLSFRWGDPEKIDNHINNGYVIIKRPKKLKKRIQPDGETSQVDDTIRSRGMILLGLEKDIVKEFEDELAYLADAQEQSVVGRLEEKREALGARLRKSGYSEREIEEFLRMFESSIMQEEMVSK
jgi:hypothetical protein